MTNETQHNRNNYERYERAESFVRHAREAREERSSFAKVLIGMIIVFIEHICPCGQRKLYC